MYKHSSWNHTVSFEINRNALWYEISLESRVSTVRIGYTSFSFSWFSSFWSLVCSLSVCFSCTVSSPVVVPQPQGLDDKKLVNQVQDNHCLHIQTDTGLCSLLRRVSENWKLLLCSVPHATTVTVPRIAFSKSCATLCCVPLGCFCRRFFLCSAPFRFNNFSLKHIHTESEFLRSLDAHADYTELLNALLGRDLLCHIAQQHRY